MIKKITRPEPALIERLVQITGPEHALLDPDRQAPYLKEWRDRYQASTPVVLCPGSTAEVAAIVKLASKTGTAIVPQGGNTGLVGGQLPFEAGNEIIIALHRLNQVRSVDRVAGYMTLEAGVTLAGAQQTADQAGFLFPLSLASEGSCQIGGTISTNAGGTAVLAYGPMRDLVAGLEVVLPDGEIWHGLRALRKDNTGYDLKQLFIGAEGTLGIVTAAVLKLFARPRAKLTSFVAVAGLPEMGELFALTKQRFAQALTGFEILPRRGMEFSLKHGGGDTRNPFASLAAPWYALIELSAFREDERLDSGLEAVLGEALEGGLVTDAVIAANMTQAKAFWRIREQMSAAQKPEGGSIKHDISVPVSAIPEFITRADQAVQALIPGARPVPFGHFGDGNIHYNISQPEQMDKQAFLARWEDVSAVVHEIVRELNGSISAEHGIGRLKREMLQEAKPALELALMRRIKQAFDPAGIMNPGKLLDL